MKIILSFPLLLLAALALAVQSLPFPTIDERPGQLQNQQPAQQAEDRAAIVRRGRYLAHHVAMCVECHTPRGEGGKLDRLRFFQGAPIPLKSPFPNRAWATFAPRIAGLPGRSEEDLVQLLETGRDSRGWSPRGPMPGFRMQRDEAAAIAAYLASLKP